MFNDFLIFIVFDDRIMSEKSYAFCYYGIISLLPRFLYFLLKFNLFKDELFERKDVTETGKLMSIVYYFYFGK